MVVTGRAWRVAPAEVPGAGMTPLPIPAVIPAQAGIQRCAGMRIWPVDTLPERVYTVARDYRGA